MSTTEGPLLELLLGRLANTPRDFCDAPRIGERGALHVDALVFDLCRELTTPCTLAELAPFQTSKAGDANWLNLVAIACWLLAAPELQAQLNKTTVLPLLADTLAQMAAEYAADKYLHDPERREELVRIALAALGLRPAGESEAQAQDRLQALSSTERRRILAAARETEKRAREIREALIQKAAAEAADKYTRE